jgi:hypothetical protein
MAGELDAGADDGMGSDDLRQNGRRTTGKTGMRMTWNGPGHELDVLL